MRSAALSLLLTLVVGCASTVDVELTVRSGRSTTTTLMLERHPVEGPPETLFLGRLLPGGKNTARFVAERGGRLILHADHVPVAKQSIPADAPDPLVVEMRVD